MAMARPTTSPTLAVRSARAVVVFLAVPMTTRHILPDIDRDVCTRTSAASAAVTMDLGVAPPMGMNETACSMVVQAAVVVHASAPTVGMSASTPAKRNQLAAPAAPVAAVRAACVRVAGFAAAVHVSTSSMHATMNAPATTTHPSILRAVIAVAAVHHHLAVLGADAAVPGLLVLQAHCEGGVGVEFRAACDAGSWRDVS